MQLVIQIVVNFYEYVCLVYMSAYPCQYDTCLIGYACCIWSSQTIVNFCIVQEGQIKINDAATHDEELVQHMDKADSYLLEGLSRGKRNIHERLFHI